MFDALKIPNTISTDPRLDDKDPKILTDVTRGMREAKLMLREVFGTQNVHTFGVSGTEFSGIDCMLSAILSSDKVVVFVNGTFSSLDGLTIRMKAGLRNKVVGHSMIPEPDNVIIINTPRGQSVTGDIVSEALATYRPKWALMAHWETGSDRTNDLQGFSDACLKHETMGMIHAVSSLGLTDFSIDDYSGVVAWASCPQKGVLCLPLPYSPVSLTDQYIDTVNKSGVYSYEHHPILEARHWGIVEGADTDACVSHRSHSNNAVAAFHEALRLLLVNGREKNAADYEFYESLLKEAVEEMGCEVTSNTVNPLVLNLPGDFVGRERELIQYCRAEGFDIWPTLSEPEKIRIGILNQLSQAGLCDIVSRFCSAMRRLGVVVDKLSIMEKIDRRFSQCGS